MKRKVNKHNVKKEAEPKIYDWEDYPNTKTLQMQPANKAFKERLAFNLVAFADNPKNYMLEEFLNQEGITWSTYNKWRGEFPQLEMAHERAMQQFGINREKLCMERNLNINHVSAFVLPHYSKRWRDEFEYRASIKDPSAKDTNIKVVIESFQPEQVEVNNFHPEREKLTPQQLALQAKKKTERVNG